MPVRVEQPASSPLQLARTILEPVLGPVETTLIIFIVAIFILMQKEDLRDRVIRLIGSGDLHRTTVALDDDGHRVLSWPQATLYRPARTQRGTQLWLLTGAEPARTWQGFAAEFVDIALREDITGFVALGSMMSDVPHTRPISVFAGSDDDTVRTSLNLERSTYEGPVGILSVLADAVEAAGVPTLSIWASVPHYVHNAPSPKATLALIEKLDELSGVAIPRGELAAESTAWESGIDALAAEDDDMAGYIEQLEQARDTVDSPEASGEAIAQEFERYLRRRDGKGGDGRPDDPRYPPVP
jgi:hypothetical protein